MTVLTSATRQSCFLPATPRPCQHALQCKSLANTDLEPKPKLVPGSTHTHDSNDGMADIASSLLQR